jgi:hypothetical protein
MSLFQGLISFGVGVEKAALLDPQGPATTLFGAPSSASFLKAFGLNTVSGADTGRFVIAAGPGINNTRCGYLSLGGANNSNINTTLSSVGTLLFNAGANLRWTISASGILFNDSVNGGNIGFARPSTGLSFTPGAGQRAGTTAAMASGVVTTANTSVTANTRVLATRKTPGGTMGLGYRVSVSAGVSFTITAVDAANATVTTDTSTWDYMLIEVA